MKGQWEVETNFINGARLYRAYRLRDTSAVDHSGNREYAGAYTTDQAAAETTAKLMNATEEE